MKTIQLTQDQQAAFDCIIKIIDTKREMVLQSYDIADRLISLSGAAGTGKTYLTTQIVRYLKEKGIPLTITAPTHKAVSVLSKMLSKNKIDASCKTIHAFLGIKLFQDFEAGKEVFKVDKTNKTPNTTSVLIVDESSMISFELYEYILEAIESSRVDIVLFVGDPNQLLPIGNNKNNIFELKNHFTLNEVVRQAKDSYIIKIATKIREMIQTQNFISPKDFFTENYIDEIEYFHNQNDFNSDFYKSADWNDKDQIVASHKNRDVDLFNNLFRNKYWGQNGVINPPMILSGDKLIFKSTYTKSRIVIYQNNQEVIVEDATFNYDQTLRINYWSCQSIYNYRQETFHIVDSNSVYEFNNHLQNLANKAKKSKYPKNIEYWIEFFTIRDRFADIQYKYASTIHKLQGSTFETVYIDIFSLIDNPYLSLDEKYRLIYVAITRAGKDIKLLLPAFYTQKKDIQNPSSECESNVLAISKEKLDNNIMSVGAISSDGKYLQLLYLDGEQEINVNDNLIIKYYQNENVALPHSEDIYIHSSKKISVNNRPLISIIDKLNINVYNGNPTGLFYNKLSWEKDYWTNIGYISTFDISDISVCFWKTDKDLYLNNTKYEYVTDENTYSFEYTGAYPLNSIIPEGAILQMVLTRSNGIIEKFNEEKFYLQIGEYFLLDTQDNIIKTINKAIYTCKKININYFKNGNNTIYENLIPYKVWKMKDNYYVALECEDIYKFKLLRVDKIQYIEIQESPFVQNKNIREFINYIQTPFPKYTENFKDNMIEIKVEISAEKSTFFEIKKHLPSQKIIERKENGNLIILFTVTQERELEDFVKQWIPYIKVIEPKSLDEKIKEDIKQYLS